MTLEALQTLRRTPLWLGKIRLSDPNSLNSSLKWKDWPHVAKQKVVCGKFSDIQSFARKQTAFEVNVELSTPFDLPLGLTSNAKWTKYPPSLALAARIGVARKCRIRSQNLPWFVFAAFGSRSYADRLH